MHGSGGQTERGGITCKVPEGELRALNADGPSARDPNVDKERIDRPKVLAQKFHRAATPRFATRREIGCSRVTREVAVLGDILVRDGRRMVNPLRVAA